MTKKRPVRLILLAMIAALLSLTGCFSTQEIGNERNQPIQLIAEQLSYQQPQLQAATGIVNIDFSNPTFLPHTFTIDELHVDIELNPNSSQRLSFRAPPGEYSFYCSIPGHTEAGMVGTLTVKEMTVTQQ